MVFIPPPSNKQIKYIHDLERKTGIYYKTEPRNSHIAARRIKKLLDIWRKPRLL